MCAHLTKVRYLLDWPMLLQFTIQTGAERIRMSTSGQNTKAQYVVWWARYDLVVKMT